jgi:hypothetical protein
MNYYIKNFIRFTVAAGNFYFGKSVNLSHLLSSSEDTFPSYSIVNRIFITDQKRIHSR